MTAASEPSALLRAYVAIEELESELVELRRTRSEPVAIVGLGCRFPGGGTDPESFWEMLRGGVDASGEVPADRWDVEEFYDADPEAAGRMYTRRGHFLAGVDRFDAGFFGISPREAASLDPQQRLLLEVSWEALEHAGQVPAALAGSRTGVFIGLMTNDYLRLQTGGGDPGQFELYVGTGNDLSFPAGRLSYLLGLRGPSLAVTTACSSSLVALHLACRSLRADECGLALVGGVNAMLVPDAFLTLSRMRALSPDGRCKAFDASADGYGRGEGCGVVVLKRLPDAERDGDRVLAVVRGSAVNHDGPSGGLTIPNGPAQTALIRTALADAGIAGSDVDYVEAHGTGTALGDPIELRALGAALGGDRSGRVLVGSVKTNVGHLEAAAGIAGLIKVVLALRHETVPAHLHLTEPTPHVDWDALGLQVPVAATPWPRGDRPRVAGVSAFGMSGTNAHVIVAEAPAAEPGPVPAAGVLPLSAKSEPALRELAARYASRLAGADYAAVCAAAAATRSMFGHRLALVAPDAATATALLRGWLDGAVSPAVRHKVVAAGPRPRVAWLFTGQGSQYAGMAAGLYRGQPAFAGALDQCAQLLDLPLLDLLFASGQEALDQTAVTQPVLFAVEWALAQWWLSRGVEPDVVLGHSVGELAAATVAGVMSLEDGLRLAAARGRLMQDLPAGGAMAAVAAGPQAITPHLADGVVIAAYNSPVETVISGPAGAVAATVAELDGIKTTALHVSHAFHSPLMEPMLAEFHTIAATIDYHPPQRTLISGGVVDTVTASYWRDHITAPVRFTDSIRAAADCTLFQEIGPHPVLLTAARHTLDTPHHDKTWLPTLRRDRDDHDQAHTALAALWTHGVPVTWPDAPPTDLPTYPFQRERHWAAPRRRTERDGHPLLGRELRTPSLRETVYETTLGAGVRPLLAEHRITGRIVVPAAHHLVMLAAAAETGLRDVVFPRPLSLADDAEQVVQTVLDPDAGTVRLVGWTDPDWVEYAAARRDPDGTVPEPLDLTAARANCDRPIDDLDAFYAAVAEAGLELGPGFRRLGRVRCGDGAALAAVRPGTDAPYIVHPGLLDACFQLLGMVRPRDDGELAMHVPFAVDQVRVAAPAAGELWAYAQGTAGDGVTGDVRVVDSSGRVVVELLGVRLRPADPVLSRRDPADPRYEIHWQPAGPVQPQPASGGWLVLADRGGLGTELAGRLAADGTCTLARTGPAYGRTGPAEYTVDPGAPAQLKRLLDAAGDLRGVAHLWSLDGGDALPGVLHLVQALATAGRPPRLHLVTRGAREAGDPAGPLAPDQATVWGLAGTVALEHPELRCTRIDLDPAGGPDDAALLAAELRTGGDEDQVALRGGERLMPRLVRTAAPPALVPPDGPYRLQSRTAVLDDLVLSPATRRPPAGTEVEVLVRATGLNFRDVLNVLGLYPGDAGPLGLECAGEVVAVGPDVVDLTPGDRVVALAPASFGRYVTVDARLAARLPDEIDDADGAAVPVAFLTALHGLTAIGRLGQGDRVLVHAAAGGVGMAAVQLARAAGAEVFATAAPAKWPTLGQMGVRHVFSSREPGFTAAVLERTGGAGVDVVLNSLTGEFIPESLRLLAPGGRFVEIGKREIWTPEQVAAVRADVTYTAFDLVELSRDEPTAIRAMLTTLLERLAAGELRPLPRRVFGLPRAADAFRFMAQARHTGKLVISHDPGAGLVRPDGAYLITGGLGGLGLQVARRLVDRGARSLVLVGRSGGTDATAAEIAALRSTGADVAVVQADIADQDAVHRLVAGIPRLRGVIHAAGVLDDGVLLQQRPDRFARVLAPKVAGARNLDRATRDRNLDFFVLFSSIAAVLGAAGQGNYAAANAYLDLLAAQRRRAGRPGLSLAWGPWRGAGMAAERDADWWTGRGMRLVEPEQGLDLLERAIADGPAQLAVAVVDWQAYLRPFGSAPPPLLRDLAGAARTVGPDTLSLADRLAGLAAGDRPEAIADHVRELAAGVLGVAAAHTLDPHTPLNELGLDSLMAVELRNALSRSIGRPLPATLLFDYPTVDALARFVTAGLEPEPASGPAPDPAPAQERTARDVMVAEIRQLSDAEVEALLEQELSRPRKQDSHD